MADSIFTEKKRLKMANLIETTADMIDENGIDNVSVRKLADRVGMHNSTIYFYFPDEDLLLSLASVKYFKEYKESLAGIDIDHSASYESFMLIWDSYCNSVFKHPSLFYHLFFKSYGDNLTFIFDMYDAIFPDEKRNFTNHIREMYFGKNIFERCLHILKPLCGHEKTRVTTENITVINDLTVAALEMILKRMINNSQLTCEEAVKQFMDALHYIVDK